MSSYPKPVKVLPAEGIRLPEVHIEQRLLQRLDAGAGRPKTPFLVFLCCLVFVLRYPLVVVPALHRALRASNV